MTRGVLHVHSVFSDGEDSLEHVIETFRQSAMDFVAVSDHAEVFDHRRMEQYVRLCETLSDDCFLVIPGLEFALHGGEIHILGYGITTRPHFTSMDQLVDEIHNSGGIAVLAHPSAGSTNVIGPIKSKLDGIEVWNGRYDGVHAPRAESLQLLRRIRSSNMKAAAYCGIDLHQIRQAQRPIYVEVDSQSLDCLAILDALRDGKFEIRGGHIAIPSSGELSFIQQLSIAVKQPLRRRWAS